MSGRAKTATSPCRLDTNPSTWSLRVGWSVSVKPAHAPPPDPVTSRSPVADASSRLMAATSHPLATLAAIDTLRAGGNAADAAVAAVAVLGVIEPQSTGIGGDCYCLVSRPDKPVWGYNGSGRSGAKASDQLLRDKGMLSP